MLRTENMLLVKVKRGFMINGKVETRMEIADVQDVDRDERDECCCMHCGARVKLFKGSSQRHHAEHWLAEDSEKCPGGVVGKTGTSMTRATLCTPENPIVNRATHVDKPE